MQECETWCTILQAMAAYTFQLIARYMQVKASLVFPEVSAMENLNKTHVTVLEKVQQQSLESSDKRVQHKG